MTLLRVTTMHLVCGLMLSLMTGGLAQAQVGEKGCIFTQELDNPVIAEEFRGLVESFSRPGGMTAEPATGGFFETDQDIQVTSRNAGNDVDIVSLGCINCHNGGLARVAATEISHGPGSRPRGMPTSHPIGMEYDRYQDSAGYRPREAMDGKMVFVAGKVGCITCHDPFNRERQHLVMSNEWDRLCMSCHNK
jgi:predicted CXXCH cytochrome family protein